MNYNKFFFNQEDHSHEISLFLFFKCNLNCDFCFQSRINDIDINYIKNIPNVFRNNYPEELKDPNLEVVSISIKGGELFSDDIPDSMFDIYYELSEEMIELVKLYKSNIIIKIMFISNGVNIKHNRILELFQKIEKFNNVQVGLNLSYDLKGRFKTKEQFEMFQNTFWYFYNRNRINSIGFTLTKKNIDLITNNHKDIFLRTIFDRVSFDPCYYIANQLQDPYQPSDDDLFNFFKWAIDNNKFQFDIISNLIKTVYYRYHPDITCVSGKNTTYYKGTLRPNCEMFSLGLNHYFGENANKFSPEEITKMKFKMGIEKRGCLFCEYKEFCSGMCWCSILFNEYKVTECFLKRTIQYLYDHSEVKDKYEIYKKGRE